MQDCMKLKQELGIHLILFVESMSHGMTRYSRIGSERPLAIGAKYSLCAGPRKSKLLIC